MYIYIYSYISITTRGKRKGGEDGPTTALSVNADRRRIDRAQFFASLAADVPGAPFADACTRAARNELRHLPS
jgi:hypothetical protein